MDQQNDIRIVERATQNFLNQSLLDAYLLKLKNDHPHLKEMEREQILEHMNLTRDGTPTLSTVLLFCQYPQAYFPQLAITAIVVPGTEIGDLGPEGERFLDNRRIEGNLIEMLEEALHFVHKNMKNHTANETDYPMAAVREAVMNALVHRDYSVYTEGQPIRLILYSDRFELRSPCGIYTNPPADPSGNGTPAIGNPALVAAMKTLGKVENRHTGIPIIRRELSGAGMCEPQFAAEYGAFVVRFQRERD